MPPTNNLTLRAVNVSSVNLQVVFYVDGLRLKPCCSFVEIFFLCVLINTSIHNLSKVF